MGFRDNLQHLRATRGMTQEQLAMMVGGSRQSVTKWEAEKACPEMDKLLKLCQIFDCSLDDLVKGDLTQRPLDIEVPVEAAAEDTIGYVGHHSAFAKRIAFGVASIVAGVGLGLLSAGLMHNVLPDSTVLVTVFVLVFLALGLALIIPAANEHTLFMREHPFVIDFFNAEDRAGYGKRTSRQIVCGIVLILAGVLVVVVFGGGDVGDALSMMLTGSMLLLIAAGVGLLVDAGILSDMCDIEKYNLEAISNLSETDAQTLLDTYDAERRASYLRARHIQRISGAICGCIMLVATIIGLLLLFVVQFDMFWLSWAIGGICCGVVGIVASAVTGK